MIQEGLGKWILASFEYRSYLVFNVIKGMGAKNFLRMGKQVFSSFEGGLGSDWI